MGGGGGGAAAAAAAGSGSGSSRKGYCTQRCATTTTSYANLDRIMLKFRPIAPKPAIFGSENRNWVVTKTRAKRRYTRVNNKSKGRTTSDGTNIESDQSENGAEDMVTLSLLPETPGGQKDTPTTSPPSSDHDITKGSRLARSDLTAMMMQQQQQQQEEIAMSSRSAVGGSIVTVECIEAVESKFVERMMDVKNTTCPSFISDGYNRVWWTNEAFRMMVGLDSNMVWLVMKVRLPLMGWSFVCRVRLQYTWKNEKKSMVVPCDVWKMDGGDFAWRLDVQAALSLGR